MFHLQFLFHILDVFAEDLDANVVQVDLLNPKIPSGGVLSENVTVGRGVLKKGVLPHGPGVISRRLPFVPVQVVGELVQLLIPGVGAPVDVVVEVRR